MDWPAHKIEQSAAGCAGSGLSCVTFL